MRPSRLAAALLAPVILLVMTGCGDKDAAGTTGSGSTPSTSVIVTVTPPAPTARQTDGPKTTPTAPPNSTPSTPPPPTETAAGPGVDVSKPPITYEDALSHFEAARGGQLSLSRFTTPSGNIYCVLQSRYLPPACELGEGGVEDDAYCGDGPTQFIGRVELDDGVPTPICNSDTIRKPGAKTLTYGEVATAPGSPVSCLAEEIGVTCLDSGTQQGFFLARGNYVLITY